MMKDKVFCKGCGKKLNVLPFGMGDRYQEFEDGFYCETCAKLRINKRRKEI